MRLVARYPILFLLALSAFAPLAAAQSIQYDYQRLTWQDGLVGNRVNVITQDSLGFMWVGTPRNGLLRYDGYTFTRYTHDPDNPTSISSENIQSVYVDSQGTLWVGAWEGGLDRYDPLTDSFIHYRHDPDDPATVGSNRIRAMLEDREGNFWVATYGSGLNKLDRATGAFTRYPFSTENPDVPTSLSHESLRVIHEGRDGMLWLGTAGGGLNHFDPATGLFATYRHDPADPASLAHDNVWSVHEDRRGNLWVGTSGNVIHRMEPGSGSFDRFYYNQVSGEASASTKSLGNGVISSIYEDEAGALWVTGSLCCLERFDVRPDTLIPAHLPGRLRLVGHTSSYRSWDKTLWFGTTEGLFRLDPTPSKVAFHTIAAPESTEPLVLDILRNESGIVWMGTEEGVLRHDPATGAETWFRPGLEQNVLSAVSIIHQDRNGMLWVGVNDQLFSMNRRTGRVIRHRFLPTGGESGFITAIQEDTDSHLWVSAYGFGISRRDARTGRLEHFRYDPDDPTGLSSNDVQNMLLARDGTLWLGLGIGFNRFDPRTSIFTHFVPGPEERDPDISYDVHALYEDSRGFLWYGTSHGTGGIGRFDPRTGRFARMSAEDYLAYSFQEDDHGNIWITTDAGMLMYDVGQETFTLFGAEHGFDRWETGQVYLGSYKDPSGKLFIGVAGGYYAFHPNDLLAETEPSTPQVALLSLMVNGEPVEHGAGAPIATPIWRTETITLAHDQNTFDVALAALHYRNPEANSLRYQLENYDLAWREAGPDRRASYIQVPSGTYRFRVQASVEGSAWERAERSVQVVVLPPWWRTTWAYLLYGLLFLGGVFAVDRVQRRRLIARERERARERELEQARAIEQAYHELRRTKDRLVQQEKMASLGQLTAGIAHEIKNPLNFVNNFAEVNEELAQELREALASGDNVEDLLADLERNAAVIAQHGKRADGIVHAMMQHASGGTGERAPTDVHALLDEYIGLAYHGKRAQMTGFTCEIERAYDEAVGRVDMVPQEIGRVLLNLLGNAFDAVHEKTKTVNATYDPTVHVSTHLEGDQVAIRVSDNGPGIAPDTQAKIFEPFYTTKPAGSGTGLGLSLSYDIVTQGHGGTLTVENTEREGASFILTLPLQPLNR